jgi:hypothetical protein
VTVLRTLAATCEFQTLQDGLIRDRIVCGIKNLTLTKEVDICRAAEVSRKQVKALGDKSPVNVDALRKDGQRDSRQQKTRDTKRESPRYQNKKTCGNCGRSHEPKQCPS